MLGHLVVYWLIDWSKTNYELTYTVHVSAYLIIYSEYSVYVHRCVRTTVMIIFQQTHVQDEGLSRLDTFRSCV
jgi:hypothetical protein